MIALLKEWTAAAAQMDAVKLIGRLKMHLCRLKIQRQQTAGDTYMVVCRVQMFIEVWARTTSKEQEAAFGRRRSSGGPPGGKNEFEKLIFLKETKQAKSKYRRIPIQRLRMETKASSIFCAGRIRTRIDWIQKQAALTAGLLFMSFQRSIRKQFMPLKHAWQIAISSMNRRRIQRRNAIFACLV
ncbi:Dyp-type peroxidase [Domibacillus sp. PGB-M46]|uniref:Dyp-type peroxidase domain-containing protein n=1 Tax=Domibacillus sp. PGB-M46 TaxID=2910255 RepID=UPI001F57C12B|nr:Dyp-type peroxidase domain-containing protein [Domibacillus sp. PGB-M46]MCI2253915.1 Dyp-type peroxidase [Domibacillus sp. PGB-M46]